MSEYLDPRYPKFDRPDKATYLSGSSDIIGRSNSERNGEVTVGVKDWINKENTVRL